MNLHLLIGLPASGKSTYAQSNFSNEQIICADIFIHEIAELNKSSYDDVINSQEHSSEIYNKVLTTLSEAFNRQESDIVLDMMNLKSSQRKKYITMAKNNGYKVHAKLFECSDINLLSKIAGLRAKEQDIKNISLSTLKELSNLFEEITEDEEYDSLEKVDNEEKYKELLMEENRKTILIEIGSEPPKRVRLFKAGPNKTAKGTFYYDPKRKIELEAVYLLKDGRDKLPIDYTHNSLNPLLSSPDAGISAGWWTVSFEDEGIFADELEWTQRAINYLENREYRFISPAFEHDTEGNITKIINFALTNIPATYNALPLVADIRKLKEDSMAKTKEEIKDKETADVTKEEVAEVEKKQEKLEASDKEQVEIKEDTQMTLDQAQEIIAGLEKQREELSQKLSEALEQVKDVQEKLLAFEKEKEQVEMNSVLDSMSISDSERTFLSTNMSLDTLKEYAKVHKPSVIKQEEEKPSFVGKKSPDKKETKTEVLEIPGLPSLEDIKKEAEQFAKKFK